MLYNEWIQEYSLFSEISKIQTFPFIDSYGAKNLDLIYKMAYGSKTIPSNIEPLTVQELANIIIGRFGENWTKKYNLLYDEILLGVESQHIIDETVKDDSLKILTSNKTNKVSAFNDDNLTENDSNEESLNDDTTKDSNRNRQEKKISMNAIKQQLEMFNSSFVDNVCKDVSNLLSLSIY